MNTKSLTKDDLFFGVSIQHPQRKIIDTFIQADAGLCKFPITLHMTTNSFARAKNFSLCSHIPNVKTWVSDKTLVSAMVVCVGVYRVAEEEADREVLSMIWENPKPFKAIVMGVLFHPDQKLDRLIESAEGNITMCFVVECSLAKASLMKIGLEVLVNDNIFDTIESGWIEKEDMLSVMDIMVKEVCTKIEEHAKLFFPGPVNV